MACGQSLVMRLLTIALLAAAGGCSVVRESPWEERLDVHPGQSSKEQTSLACSFRPTAGELALIERNRTAEDAIYTLKEDGSLEKSRLRDDETYKVKKISDIKVALFVVKVFPPDQAGRERLGIQELPDISPSGRYHLTFDSPLQLSGLTYYLSLECYRTYGLEGKSETKRVTVKYGNRVGGRVDMSSSGGGGTIRLLTLHSALYAVRR